MSEIDLLRTSSISKPTDVSRLLKWLERDFAFAMSLGSLCHSAMALKNAELRKFSTPFDWIFSTPEIVSHCILDDFAVFLDKSMYFDVPEENRIFKDANVCEHIYYRDYFSLRYMFNHRSPNIPKEYDYLERCVRRFRLAMACRQPKFLLIITRQFADVQAYTQLLAALDKYATEFLLVVIQPRMDLSRNERFHLLEADLGPNFLAMKMFASGECNGVSFDNDYDNAALDLLLRQFKVAAELPLELQSPLFIPEIKSAPNFDEAWYLENYRDVAQAVRDGQFASGWEHYIKYGQQEGRKPRAANK